MDRIVPVYRESGVGWFRIKLRHVLRIVGLKRDQFRHRDLAIQDRKGLCQCHRMTQLVFLTIWFVIG